LTNGLATQLLKTSSQPHEIKKLTENWLRSIKSLAGMHPRESALISGPKIPLYSTNNKPFPQNWLCSFKKQPSAPNHRWKLITDS
jgi:hypothetical protein